MNAPPVNIYLPDLLLQRLSSGLSPMRDGEEPVLAAMIFADLAGFTALADRLAERGPQGPEQLSEVLDHVFGELIDLVLAFGGDVVRFAGVAILGAWPVDSEDDLPQAVLQAASCALQALQLTLEPPHLSGVSLQLRIGLGSGPMQLYRLGGLLDRWEHILAGQALRQLGVAADLARPGQVLASADAWEQVQHALRGEPCDRGTVRLVEPQAGFQLPTPGPSVVGVGRPPLPVVGEAQLRRFLPGAVRHRIDAGMHAWLAELRPLSVLFINLPVGSEQPLPDRARLQQVVHLAQRELYRLEGSVDKLLMDDKGCTLLAAYGLPPVSHEDDAERAVRAALEISAHLGSRYVPHRIGVASGRVFAGIYGHPERREYSILGDVVNLAARLMQQARGEVLCDDATRRAVGGRMEFEPLPPVKVKGKREPVAIFRPVRSVAAKRPVVTGPVAASALAAGRHHLLGREPEQARLLAALDALGEHGSGGLVLLRGVAGIGKSTLVDWLVARAVEAGVRCCYGAGDAIDGGGSHGIWRATLAELVDFTDSSDLASLRASVTAAVASHPQAMEWAPLLNGMLPLYLSETPATQAMTGHTRGENTRELLVHMLRSRASTEPLLVVLEDAQWMDAASWALALAAHRRVPGLLLVLALRPMLVEPPGELAELLSADGAALLDLQGLAPEAACELAARSLGVDRLPSSLESLLVDKAEGNPFHTEELACALRDMGLLRVKAGRCLLSRQAADLGALKLPDTVQGAVTSRLDRLDPRQQLTLKVAAVVGRSFPLQLTRAVHPVQADRSQLVAHLESAVEQGLVELELPAPDCVYRFTHSITHQVAYDLLAFSQRRQIHDAVASWYERAPVADPAAQYPRLAWHWRQAGNDEKTVFYCQRAAEQAIEGGATKQGILLLRYAVEILEEEADARLMQRVRLRRRLGEAYADLSETRLALVQLKAALSELGHPFPRGRLGTGLRLAWELWRLVLGLGWPRWLRPRRGARARQRLEEAARLEARVADECFAISDTQGMLVGSLAAINHAERLGTFSQAAHAYNTIGYVLGVAGLRRLGRSFLDRARTGDALAVSNAAFAQGLWCLGDARLTEGEAFIRSGLEHARRVGQPAAVTTGISCLGTCCELAGDFTAALDQWRELADLSHEVADIRHQFWGMIGIGGTLCHLGRVPEALDWIRRREDLLAEEDRMTAVGFHGQRAQVFLRAGEPDLARESADLARQAVHETGTAVMTHVKGLTGMCEAYLELWERSGGGVRGPGASLAPAARDACRLFRSYARRFPVGASRAARFSGTACWLLGRTRRARRWWWRAVRVAVERDLLFDEALARIELVRLGGLQEPERQEQLDHAVQRLEALELELYLEQARRLQAGEMHAAGQVWYTP